jgi:hypothetical protein
MSSIKTIGLVALCNALMKCIRQVNHQDKLGYRISLHKLEVNIQIGGMNDF